MNSEGYSASLVNVNSMSGQAAYSAKILDEVKNYHRPVAYGAIALTQGGDDAGHIWVIDGVLEQYRWHYWWVQCPPTATDIVLDIYRQQRKGRLLHCNWGWGGVSNGWFFDFSTVPAGKEEFDFAFYDYHYLTPRNLYWGIEFVGI